jgi:hypothetical protein
MKDYSFKQESDTLKFKSGDKVARYGLAALINGRSGSRRQDWFAGKAWGSVRQSWKISNPRRHCDLRGSSKRSLPP